MCKKIRAKTNMPTEDSTISSEEFRHQVYITLDQDELTFLGLPRELWDDSATICDAIHGLLYRLPYAGLKCNW